MKGIHLSPQTPVWKKWSFPLFSLNQNKLNSEFPHGWVEGNLITFILGSVNKVSFFPGSEKLPWYLDNEEGEPSSLSQSPSDLISKLLWRSSAASHMSLVLEEWPVLGAWVSVSSLWGTLSWDLSVRPSSPYWHGTCWLSAPRHVCLCYLCPAPSPQF